MKHIVINYHFVRNLVASKELQVSHLQTSHHVNLKVIIVIKNNN